MLRKLILCLMLATLVGCSFGGGASIGGGSNGIGAGINLGTGIRF